MNSKARQLSATPLPPPEICIKMKSYRSCLGNASQQQCHIRPCRPCNGRRTATSICASAEGVGETSQTGQYEAASFRRGQASSSTALVVSPATMQGSAGEAVLEEAKQFLIEELGRIFTTGVREV